MELSAIFHRTSREFVIPTSVNKINLKLLCKRNDLDKISICFWKRNFKKNYIIKELKLYCSDFYRDDYRITLELEERGHYLQYFFILQKGDEKQYFFSEGFSTNPPNKGWFEYPYTNTNEILSPPIWAKGAIYYQIFPDRFAKDKNQEDTIYTNWNDTPTTKNYFGGTLKGIEENLNYLSDLGIEAIYLNPIFKANFNHKYATTDYYKIDSTFGDENDLKNLVISCHKKNIKVILDGVFNHVGVDFKQFKEFRLNNKNAEWFFPLDKINPISKVNYECVGDYHPMPKLKTSTKEVREYILDIMLYWVKNCDIDGWRFDVADEIDITTMQYLRLMFKEQYPNCLLLGEVWGDGVKNVIAADQLDCIMNYQFRSATLDLFAKQSINCISFQDRINHVLSCYHNEINLCNFNLLSSHDVPRLLTECNKNLLNFHLAICFQMTFIGSPSIYYGDENNMEGENDPYCRATMNFNNKNETYILMKDLINLKKEYSSLKGGNFKFIKDFSGENAFAFKRFDEKNSIIVIFNLSNKLLENNRFDTQLFSYPKSTDSKIISPKSMNIFLIKEECNEN